MQSWGDYEQLGPLAGQADADVLHAFQAKGYFAVKMMRVLDRPPLPSCSTTDRPPLCLRYQLVNKQTRQLCDKLEDALLGKGAFGRSFACLNPVEDVLYAMKVRPALHPITLFPLSLA